LTGACLHGINAKDNASRGDEMVNVGDKIVSDGTQYSRNPRGTVMTVVDVFDGCVAATVDGGNSSWWYMPDGSFTTMTSQSVKHKLVEYLREVTLGTVISCELIADEILDIVYEEVKW